MSGVRTHDTANDSRCGANVQSAFRNLNSNNKQKKWVFHIFSSKITLVNTIKMCTKKEEYSNSSKTVRNGDLNVTVNKPQVKHSVSNLNTNDNPSVDFRIHTNIEFIADKKMKICLLINVFITIIFIIAFFIVTYKLHSQLMHVQSEMNSLTARIESCEQIRHKVPEQNDSETVDEMFAAAQTMHGNGLGIEEGALAAHFKGSVPEIFVKDQGLVGPWYLDNTVSRQYKFPKFHLTEGQCSIEVTEPALYLIYAQVYYVTSNALNSYSVYVRSEGSSENNIIAKCSIMGPRAAQGSRSHTAELSCYTSTIYSLKANDRIFIQQTEKNRTIILRDGHSFFGLVRLNNAHRNHKT